MFIDFLYKRRSIRTFSDQPVEKETMDALLKAALLAPSSRSRHPCRFIAVMQKETLEKLSRVKHHGAGFLMAAPCAIVVAADPDICDVWIEDASIATTYLHLASTALGLGSCWIQIRKRKTMDGTDSEEYVKELLFLPSGFRVLSIVAVGYPRTTLPPRSDGDLHFELVSYDRFGGKAE